MCRGWVSVNLAVAHRIVEFQVMTVLIESLEISKRILLLLSASPVRHWRVNTEGRACTRFLCKDKMDSQTETCSYIQYINRYKYAIIICFLRKTACMQK